MRAKEVVIAGQAAWAHVQEKEEELAKTVSELEKVDAAIQERERAVEEASERYERADQAHDAAKQHVTDLTTEIEPANQVAVEAKAKFDDVKGKLQQLQLDQRQAGSEVKAKQKEVEKYEADIKQHRKRQAEADNGLYAEKVRELDEAKVECDAAKRAYTSHDGGLPQLRDQLKEAQREEMAAGQKVEKARDDERRIRRNIDNLRGGQRNWIEAYPNPRGLNALLKAIESDGRFRERPIGPLGRHVKLLRSEWGYILEKQFGQALNSFVVTSKQDQNTLSGLMNKLGWYVSPYHGLQLGAHIARSAPIYIGNRTPINTSQNEPNPELLTWMKALTVGGCSIDCKESI
jgi:chromosome segregation ATPase